MFGLGEHAPLFSFTLEAKNPQSLVASVTHTKFMGRNRWTAAVWLEGVVCLSGQTGWISMSCPGKQLAGQPVNSEGSYI